MVRSIKDQVKELERWSKKVREVLPLTRGGTDPNPQRYRPSTRKPRPLPKVKVFNERPFFDGEEVRWVPTTPHPNAIPIRGPPQEMTRVTRREEDEMQRELQDLFDQLPTEGEQELAYLTLREENETGAQNQTLENALARMGADRPKQFQRLCRSHVTQSHHHLAQPPYICV